jgi:hypothetical protein
VTSESTILVLPLGIFVMCVLVHGFNYTDIVNGMWTNDGHIEYTYIFRLESVNTILNFFFLINYLYYIVKIMLKWSYGNDPDNNGKLY